MCLPQLGQGVPRAVEYVLGVAGVGARLRLLEDWNVATRGRCHVVDVVFVVFVVFAFFQFVVVDETHVDVVVVGQPLGLGALQGLHSMVCLLGEIHVVVLVPRRSLPLLWGALVLMVGGGSVQQWFVLVAGRETHVLKEGGRG